jgi:hypothetical protein
VKIIVLAPVVDVQSTWMSVRIVLVMVLGACRFNFDPVAGTDALTDGVLPLDAPIDPDAPAGSVTEVFGETPNATRTNVTADAYVSSEGASQGDNFGGSPTLSLESNEKRACSSSTSPRSHRVRSWCPRGCTSRSAARMPVRW